MQRLRLPLSLALLCVVVAMAVPVQGSARTPAKRMVDGINWWRSAAGLRAVHRSTRLRRSSRWRARQMMRRDVFAHPARLRVPHFNRLGEVLELHGGHRPLVGRTIRRWSRSSGHRQVLLSHGLRGIGVGRASGWWRGRRATIWVVRVGRK